MVIFGAEGYRLDSINRTKRSSTLRAPVSIVVCGARIMVRTAPADSQPPAGIQVQLRPAFTRRTTFINALTRCRNMERSLLSAVSSTRGAAAQKRH